MGLTLTSDGPGELAVAWNAASPEPVDYRVSWARSEEEYLTWTDDDGNAFPTTNSLTLTDLDEDEEYKVLVRARYGDDGSGPWSDEVRQIVAAAARAPSNLTAETDGCAVKLNWEAPADNADDITGYRVLRAKGTADLSALADDTGSPDTTYPESTDGRRVTDATVRARIRVDWRLAGGLSALLGVLIAACDGCGERDGGIGHGKKHSRTGPGASWRGS